MLLLSGDQTTDTPQRLLDSPRMRQVIDLLRSKLDFVIIDSPPAGILSDTATMAKYTDATVYVVRQDHEWARDDPEGCLRYLPHQHQ